MHDVEVAISLPVLLLHILLLHIEYFLDEIIFVIQKVKEVCSEKFGARLHERAIVLVLEHLLIDLK